MNPDVVIALIGVLSVAIGASIPGIISLRQNRLRADTEAVRARSDARRAGAQSERDRAETERIIAENTAALWLRIDDLTDRVLALETEVVHLRRLLDIARRGINALVRQIRELGHTPAWEPPDEIGGPPMA